MNRRAALLALFTLAACSAPGDKGSNSVDLAPPPDGTGVQYRMVGTLDPGQEIERCRFFVTPPGGLYVTREETRFSPGSHHMLLYSTPYTEVPTVDLNGQTHDTGDVFDCVDGATRDWSVDGVVGGSQDADGTSFINDMPEGVAFRIEPGTVLLMNTHYLNATNKALAVDARINLYTTTKDKVQTEAGMIFFYAGVIRVPGHSSAVAHQSCPVLKDVTLLNGQSHMHKRGLGEVANIVDGETGALIEPLYESKSWENVPVKEWSPGKKLSAGTAIDYTCSYRNDEDRTVLQGLSTRDEMCMFIGLYYPRDRQFELCSTDDTFTNTSRNMTYIGSGDQGCLSSLLCVQRATDDDSLFACVTDSCAEVAKPFNAALKCAIQQGDACEQQCADDADPEKCQGQCVQANCSGEISACAAANCN